MTPHGTALFGATGYAGREAARLLAVHPTFRLEAVFGGPEREGVPLATVHPSLCGVVDQTCEALDADDACDRVAAALPGRGIAFALLATPETTSMRLAPALVRAGIRVVDLSGAFRLRAGDYPEWYGFEHGAAALLERAVYGLTEWERDAVASTPLVANPGCYPTAALLALLPLIRAGILDPDLPVIVHAVSGASGAGRRMRDDLLFCEVEGSIRPYGLPHHRHLAEIAGRTGLDPDTEVLFIPHLAPLDRGLLCTLVVRLGAGAGPGELVRIFASAYDDAPFVRVLGEGRLPATGDVRGTNACAIGWSVMPRGRLVVLHAVIDNLVKGAAGQAVQNLNLMAGRPEAEGLPR